MGFIFSSRSRLESVFKPKEISYRGLRHCIQVKEQGNRNEVCWPSSCFLSPFPVQNPLPREWDSGLPPHLTRHHQGNSPPVCSQVNAI